jgi:hypothetical protein
VLAHYAQASAHSAADLATPATLVEVFDHFVFDASPALRQRDDGSGRRPMPAACRLL